MFSSELIDPTTLWPGPVTPRVTVPPETDVIAAVGFPEAPEYVVTFPNAGKFATTPLLTVEPDPIAATTSPLIQLSLKLVAAPATVAA